MTRASSALAAGVAVLVAGACRPRPDADRSRPDAGPRPAFSIATPSVSTKLDPSPRMDLAVSPSSTAHGPLPGDERRLSVDVATGGVRLRLSAYERACGPLPTFRLETRGRELRVTEDAAASDARGSRRCAYALEGSIGPLLPGDWDLVLVDASNKERTRTRFEIEAGE